jgi:HSP20 family protein
MNSPVKTQNNKRSLWNDPFNRFFRNDMMDFWNKDMETIPSLNISEEKDKYKVEVAAPGLKKEDFNIDVNGNLVTISSEKESETNNEKENGHYSRREYNYSSFSRSFTLPENANADAVKAKYCDGVLCLDIPKKKQAPETSSKKVKVE